MIIIIRPVPLLIKTFLHIFTCFLIMKSGAHTQLRQLKADAEKKKKVKDILKRIKSGWTKLKRQFNPTGKVCFSLFLCDRWAGQQLTGGFQSHTMNNPEAWNHCRMATKTKQGQVAINFYFLWTEKVCFRDWKVCCQHIWGRKEL